MALNNLRRGALKPGKTIPVILNMFPGSPTLHCEHLGNENYGFINDMMRGSGAEGVKVGATSRSPEALGRVRTANREIVAKHSVRRIEGFYYDDADGNPDLSKPVPSTLAAIAEVINALPDDVFDMLLAVVSDSERYRDVPITASADDIAKK
jgi:hypothetical protein